MPEERNALTRGRGRGRVDQDTDRCIRIDFLHADESKTNSVVTRPTRVPRSVRSRHDVLRHNGPQSGCPGPSTSTDRPTAPSVEIVPIDLGQSPFLANVMQYHQIRQCGQFWPFAPVAADQVSSQSRLFLLLRISLSKADCEHLAGCCQDSQSIQRWGVLELR